MIGVDEILKRRKREIIAALMLFRSMTKPFWVILLTVVGFLELIKSVQPAGRWKLVVVDSLSLKILNSACKMYDILEENVRYIVISVILAFMCLYRKRTEANFHLAL